MIHLLAGDQTSRHPFFLKNIFFLQSFQSAGPVGTDESAQIPSFFFSNTNLVGRMNEIIFPFFNKKMATIFGRRDDVGAAEWHSPVKVRPSAEEKRGGKEGDQQRPSSRV